MDRRNFLKTLGVAAGSAAVGKEARAADVERRTDTAAMLFDTTACAGCRECELACAEQNGLPEPDTGDDAMDSLRDTSETQFTVVNRFETEDAEVFVRKQCMHCLEPACASACLTRAMYKTPEGPVIWRGDKCMGCRYCMVSCPFDVPKFEYFSANPRILKCRMCWERVVEGEKPACVENCPEEAILFGPRDELITEARRRIAENPDQYVNHVYGEHEAGGTGMLFLASAEFEQLGFRTDLDDSSYPELTVPFLYSVPVILTLFPALLLGVHRATGSSDDSEE